MKNKRVFKERKYYLNIAEDYIKQQIKKTEGTEYYLDEKLALKCIKFASLLKHTSGSFAGVNFQFQEWQIKAIVDIFATKYRDGEYQGYRRYQRALFFMPKKNGKSEFGGLFHAIMFFIDKDKAKEQYSLATEAEQAKIIHKVFLTMLKQEPELFELVHSTVKPPKITKQDGAFTDEFQSLTSSADTKDGLRPSFLTIDEGHAHTSKDLYQIMTDGMAGRDEPLEIHLSTAGYNQLGFFFLDIYSYAKKVVSGVIKDDRFYAVLFEPSEEDMKDENFWKDKKIWKKANPNLGNSPTYSYMEGKIAAAENSEQSRISFLTKHLNVWCDKVDVWISTEKWNASFKYVINEEELKGRLCYAGLDLSSNTDITAFILLFPKDDGGFDILPRFWIPKDSMKERSRRDKVPYEQWVKEGLIQVTEGNVIDYDFIEDQIKKDYENFNIKMTAFDRWNSSGLVSSLSLQGIDSFVPFGQGFASMAAPTKEIETLVLQKNLNHGNNKVLKWMCSNVAIKKDPADNMKIDKAKSSEKVDGMVALAMALGIYLTDDEAALINPYEHGEFRFV